MPDEQRNDWPDYQQVTGFLKPGSEVFTLNRATLGFEPATVVSCKPMYGTDAISGDRYAVILQMGRLQTKVENCDCYIRKNA